MKKLGFTSGVQPFNYLTRLLCGATFQMISGEFGQ
jgi:hypothetical protein